MINYEKKQSTATRFADDYVDYDPAMTVSQNAYTQEDYDQGVQTNTSTADFQEMISTTAENVNNGKTDLYPSSTTMQFYGKKDRRYIYEDFSDTEEMVEEEEESSYKINTKGKVMIAVYALVVLTIFTLIIMNTRLIKNMNDSINEQEARIEALQQENNDLQAQFEIISSDEEVVRYAEGMGMIKG